MLVYAIRHGESLHNARREDGLNTPLSPLGIQQAHAVARRFEGLRIAAIYSSPFFRCVQTASAVAARLRMPFRIHPSLIEFHHLAPGTEVTLGLEDIETIVSRHSDAIPCPDYDGPFEWPPPDESIFDLIARVHSFAATLKARWDKTDDTVILISHGSPIARLIEAWLSEQPGPSFRFTIDNATVAALRYVDGVSSLVCLNETSHLRELPIAEQANYREDGSIKPQPATRYW
ncbi:MAG: histidine phosphatase family protein [Planctomycetota bacterium]